MATSHTNQSRGDFEPLLPQDSAAAAQASNGLSRPQLSGRPATGGGFTPGRAAAMGVGALAIAGLSFFGGVQYQKGHATTATAANSSGQRQFGGSGGSGFGSRMGSGAMGTVTAISSSSITVQDERQNTTKTYAITSSTQITNQGSTASVSDIAKGDQVFVQASSSASTDATRIAIGGMGGPGGSAPDGSGSSQSQSN